MTNVFLLCLVGAILCTLPALMGACRHIDSSYVMMAVEDVAKNGGRDGNGNKLEALYSKRIGTVLILYHMPSNRTAGIVWRITENNGTAHLGEQVYETTAFSADRAYWERVIWRDGYVSLTRAMAIAITAWSASIFTGILWMATKLRQYGRDGTAEWLEGIKADGS